jgi:hypothetical protein
VHFLSAIAEHYPDAKLILTLRDASSWWDSYARTIMASLKKPESEISDPNILSIVRMVTEMLGPQAFGASFDDQGATIAAYNTHVDLVRHTYPVERLLQLDITDGWEPLCSFLDVPVPDAPFPKANSSREFWDDDTRAELK